MKKIATLALGACLLAAFVAAPGYGQTAQDVLSKMIDAMGGRKAIQAIKDTTIRGTADIAMAGQAFPFTIYQKEPNKLRLEIEVAAANMTIIQAFDGQKGWGTSMQTGMIEEMPDYMTKELSHQALGNAAFLDPQKLGITYALKPKAAIDGKDYIVLEQTLADGHKVTMFIDPATYLVFKVQAKSVDMTGAEVDAESFFSDYRKVDGVMMAFSQHVLNAGTEAQSITISSVTFNTNIDDAIFVMK